MTDFGAILDKWEKSTRSKIVDKDAESQKAADKKKAQSSSYIRSLKPEASIDLHGLTQEEAWRALNDFVSAAKHRGLKKILIIHGKGIHSPGGQSALASLVHKFVQYDLRLGASGSADNKNGGSGATWVFIKQ